MSEAQWALAVAEAAEPFAHIAASSGNLVAYEREASYALQIIQGSDWLQKCSRESLRNAIINVAAVGLTLSPAHKLAYLVPRKGKACLDISYIGLVKIATDSGAVQAVHATIVRANDKFRYIDAFTNPDHEFNPFATIQERGEVIGVYSVAKLASGHTVVDTMSREEIDKIRSKSEAKNGPWGEWFDEMAKKSVLKRASKLWPRTDRLSKSVELLEEQEGGGITIEDAQAALSAAEERKARLVKLAQEAPTKEALQAVWQSGLAEVRTHKDKAAYDALKDAVSLRTSAIDAAREAA
jgi:recombination protein RecT